MAGSSEHSMWTASLEYQEDFKTDARMIYYLDALMVLSSLQQELDFQVAEYGESVASEDMKCLRELLAKFPKP